MSVTRVLQPFLLATVQELGDDEYQGIESLMARAKRTRSRVNPSEQGRASVQHQVFRFGSPQDV